MKLGQTPDYLLIAKFRQFRPRDHTRPQPQLVSYGASSHSVVASDHPDVDPGVKGNPYRIFGFSAQGVNYPDDGHKYKVGDLGHRVRR